MGVVDRKMWPWKPLQFTVLRVCVHMRPRGQMSIRYERLGVRVAMENAEAIGQTGTEGQQKTERRMEGDHPWVESRVLVIKALGGPGKP